MKLAWSVMTSWIAGVACGPGLAVQHPAPGTLAEVSGDAAAIERLLDDSVVHGGLYFADPACAAQFAQPGPVAASQRAAFARCLAGLQLVASERASMLPGVDVLTYAPGFEVEAQLSRTRAGTRLRWIGFATRRDDDVHPTITPAAFEALREAGTPHGPIDPAVGATLTQGDPAVYTWLKVCIDETGAVASTSALRSSSLEASGAFTTAARAWKFRPFLLDGQPRAACSTARLVYPPEGDNEAGEARLPIAPSRMPDGSEPVMLDPPAVEKQRMAGSKQVVPDDLDKTKLGPAGGRLSGVFKLCVGPTGTADQVKALVSTGLPNYDAKIIRAMQQWTYRPFLVNGAAVPVCTNITFLYSQH